MLKLSDWRVDIVAGQKPKSFKINIIHIHKGLVTLKMNHFSWFYSMYTTELKQILRLDLKYNKFIEDREKEPWG